MGSCTASGSDEHAELQTWEGASHPWRLSLTLTPRGVSKGVPTIWQKGAKGAGKELSRNME